MSNTHTHTHTHTHKPSTIRCTTHQPHTRATPTQINNTNVTHVLLADECLGRANKGRGCHSNRAGKMNCSTTNVDEPNSPNTTWICGMKIASAAVRVTNAKAKPRRSRVDQSSSTTCSVPVSESGRVCGQAKMETECVMLPRPPQHHCTDRPAKCSYPPSPLITPCSYPRGTTKCERLDDMDTH
jgi:hypothetical protein